MKKITITELTYDGSGNCIKERLTIDLNNVKELIIRYVQMDDNIYPDFWVVMWKSYSSLDCEHYHVKTTEKDLDRIKNYFAKKIEESGRNN